MLMKTKRFSKESRGLVWLEQEAKTLKVWQLAEMLVG
jgi:hypothetical protein